jgi:cytidine deaminase
MSLLFFRMDRKQADLAGAMIRAAVDLTRHPYDRLPAHCGVAVVAGESGTAYAALTLENADGYGGRAHALRSAITAQLRAKSGVESKIVMAAVFEWSEGSLKLKMPCGHCREVLGRYAGAADPLILGIDPITRIPAVVELSRLLPFPRGRVDSLHVMEKLLEEIEKHVHEPS